MKPNEEKRLGNFIVRIGSEEYPEMVISTTGGDWSLHLAPIWSSYPMMMTLLDEGDEEVAKMFIISMFVPSTVVDVERLQQPLFQLISSPDLGQIPVYDEAEEAEIIRMGKQLYDDQTEE